MSEKGLRLNLDRKWATTLLLIATSLFLFILPALPASSNFLAILLISIILMLASLQIPRRVVWIGIPAILIEAVTRATDLVYLSYLSTITTNLFVIYVVLHVILDIMKQREVNPFTLLEAVNGYLLLGILFISLVGFCELVVPGSFSFQGDQGTELIYYTLVTMTTVGYGDITPQLPVAKSLSMFIAISGQFYIATVVAIIVGKYASNSSGETK
jgi:hypothetical protein